MGGGGKGKRGERGGGGGEVNLLRLCGGLSLNLLVFVCPVYGLSNVITREFKEKIFKNQGCLVPGRAC